MARALCFLTSWGFICLTTYQPAAWSRFYSVHRWYRESKTTQLQLYFHWEEALEIEALIRTEGSLFFFIRDLSPLTRDRTQALVQWKCRGLTLDHQGSPPKGVLMTFNLLGGWEKPLEIYRGTPALRPGHCEFIFRDLNGNVDRMLTILLMGRMKHCKHQSKQEKWTKYDDIGPTGQTQSLLSLTINLQVQGDMSNRINSQVARRFVAVWTGRKNSVQISLNVRKTSTPPLFTPGWNVHVRCSS